VRLDDRGWSGDGAFTRLVLEALKGDGGIEFIRVEDAPASRAESGYAFISNEIYVKFTRPPARRRWTRLLRPDPGPATASGSALAALAARLSRLPDVGEPDYADDGLLQYLRTERITAPYQTRGIKLVELVRIYEAGAPPRA